MRGDRVLERLARAVHERYLWEQQADGAVVGQSRAMMAWDRLDDDKREASRAQARDIGAKLAEVGCVVVSKQAQTDLVVFSVQEIESLARREHLRWARQRRAAGWVYGQQRDDDRKRHPSLVTWARLSETEKDKDRDAVRNIGAILASAGLAVKRDGRPASPRNWLTFAIGGGGGGERADGRPGSADGRTSATGLPGPPLGLSCERTRGRRARPAG